MQNFFSHGKLLITGEYLVLDGALSLAIPTSFGQRMEVEFQENDGDNTLSWYSIDSEGETWFREEFLIVDDENGRSVKCYALDVCNSNAVSDKLIEILSKAVDFNPDFLAGGSYVVKSYLDFPNNWGLGSSSTLICNIAKWAQVDAFELSNASFGGSGYDIAVGMLGGDVLYRNPVLWEGYVYNPPFKNELFFVHLNKKQNSREGIATYRSKEVDAADIDSISQLTEELIQADTIHRFSELITKHEQIVSNIVEMPTVKEKLFADYPKAIKSLGAWGGDFILAVGNEEDKAYFRNKGYTTILGYSELIK